MRVPRFTVRSASGKPGSKPQFLSLTQASNLPTALDFGQTPAEQVLMKKHIVEENFDKARSILNRLELLKHNCYFLSYMDWDPMFST